MRGAILVLIAFVAGCSHLREYTMPSEKNLLSGAGSVLVGENGVVEGFELLNLDGLFETYGFKEPVQTSLQLGGDGDALKYRRNELQSRIIAASNQRCGEYLRILTSAKAQTQMLWNGLSALLAGAASVTTPTSLAQSLSAGSAVSTAFGSQYEQSYYSNLTVSIISSGISKRRQDFLAAIDKNRSLTLLEYPVNRAVADALEYHAACNVVVGLEAAADAIAQ